MNEADAAEKNLEIQITKNAIQMVEIGLKYNILITAVKAIEAMKIILPILNLSAMAPKRGLTVSPTNGKIENMSPTPT